MKKLLTLFLLLAAAIVVPQAVVSQAMAQPGPVSVRPDCFQFFTFTATGNSNVFDNRSAGCPYFAIAYSSSGFSALSLVLQVAPDNNGVPGTWATYTANSGSNPNTAITQASSTFSGYFPWVRVQLTSKTGTGSLSGIFYGWRIPAAVISGGGAGCPSPCPVVGTGTAGTPAGGVLTVQGSPSGTPIPVSNTPSGTQTVAGNKTNNNAAPGATNLGTLPAIANAAAPTWTEGNQVGMSVDLSGNLRVSSTSSGTTTIQGNKTNNNAAPGSNNLGTLPGVANAAAPTYIEGDQVAASLDLAGGTRVTGGKSTNTAAPGSNNVGVLPGLANAAAPSLSEGFLALMSLDLSGNLRVTNSPTGTQTVQGNKTNNNAAPGSNNLGVLPCIANAAAPTWTEGFQVNCSEDLSGNLRVTGAVTQTATSTALADGASNTEALPTASAAAVNQRVFGMKFNGSTWDRDFACTNQALFNLSGSGNTQIIALSGSTVIRVCAISFSTTATEDVKLTSGTGSNCGSGTADVTGLYKSVQSMDLNLGPDKAIRAPAAAALCLNQSAGQALGGIVIYAQF